MSYALYALDVIVWTCVSVFVVTCAITILALVGKLRLGGGSQALNEYFLKRLFVALLIEVIGTSVAIYAAYANGIRDTFHNSELNLSDLKMRVTNLEKASTTGGKPVISTKWELVRTGDCSGNDTDSTAGPIPRENLCSSKDITSVCWDGGTYKNGASAWCTYKKININSCNGGSAPGQMYKCNP
jgi:hypothetical protein